MARLISAVLPVLLACSGAPLARADAPGIDPDPLHFLSDCLGRVSAERVHLDAFGDGSGAARAQATRDALAALVSLMTPEDGADRVLIWRAEARAAQVALLSQATLQADARAAALARRFVARCESMIVLPDHATPPDRAD